jgi:uncharacterized protein YbaA (DUF1428 family)
MAYIDGYLIPVPDKNRDAYIALAEQAAAIFKKHGATQVVEAWGDDVPEGQHTSFPMAVKREEGETVVFSWVMWPSKAVRDAGMKAFMDEMQPTPESMPFDGKRMIFGGFQAIVEA